MQVAEHYLPLRSEFDLVDGSYMITGPLGSPFAMDHTWIETKIAGQVAVVDLTLAQFRCTEQKLYVGPRTAKFKEYIRIPFSDVDAIIDWTQEG